MSNKKDVNILIRVLIGVGVVILMVVITAALIILSAASSVFEVDSGTGILFSSPSTPIAIEVKRGKREETNFTATIVESNLVELTKIDNILYLKSTSITNQGNLHIIIRSGKNVWSNTISVRISTADKDNDGYPDVVELGDSEAFREWFCAIIESQFFYPNDNWYDIHKDCVGLVEFAFKEALKKHDNNWAKNYKYLPPVNINDSRDYYYPDVPLINKRVFRVKPGEFTVKSITNDFAYTAEGSTLRTYSMVLVSKDINSAKKGDILFFFHEKNLKMPSHSMVYIGSDTSKYVKDGFLIYHTGPSDTSRGFIKKVQVSDLLKHPDSSWRPTMYNPNFYGVYRWKILE